MARQFQQAPGGGQLWKVGNSYYLAYTVPRSKPPIFMTWKVEGGDLDAIVGPGGSKKPDRTLTADQFRRTGALNFGDSKELVNFQSEPFEQFIRDYDLEARVQPWLKDPEVLALVTSSILEGRQPTRAELSNTNYFRNHSQAELDYAVLKATDPKTAKNQDRDRRIQVQSMLRERGIDAPRQLVDLLAGKWSSGQWTETMVTSQIQGLNDPYLGFELDREVINAARSFNPEPGDRSAIQGGADAVRKRITAIYDNRGLAAPKNVDALTKRVLAGDTSLASIRATANRAAGLHPTTELDLTREGEMEVQQLVLDWLGPALAKQYEGRWTRGWAGKLRSDPNAQADLIDELKQLRAAAFPEWTNENLRYADVAPTAKALFDQVWAENPGEDDPLFMDVLRMTAPGGAGLSAAAEKLRREGLTRGVSSVTQQASEGILAAGGGDVRGSLV